MTNQKEWVITVYQFNEQDMQYRFHTMGSFKTDKELIDFITRNAKDTRNIRYTITYKM